MHISKLTKMAAAVSLAAALSACGAGGNGDSSGNTGNNASGKTAEELCADAAARPNQTTLDAVQVTLCDALDDTALAPVNNVIAGLIEDTPLSELFDRLNELLSPSGELAPVNELIQALIGANGNGALTPVIGGLNAVLVGLLSGNPEAIAGALQGFGGAAGGGGGSGGPTGTPLDALLALGGESNPLAALLGQLPGAGGGTGGGTNGGLITNVQNLLNNLTGGTPLIEVANLVDTLLNPQSGALAPLTEALEDLTMVDGGPLGPVTELVGALISANDAALAPLIVALNEILVGLLTNQDPAAIAEALQGLAGNLGGGGDNPLAGLLPGLPGLPSEGTPGAGSDGLITSVQELVDNLLGDTVLAPVQDLVNTLVDPASGALSPLTGVVNDITSSEEALGQVTALVDMLIAQDDAALAPVIEGLNGVLSLGGITGGGAGLPGLDSADQLNAIPVIGPILSGLLGGLSGGLPI